VPDALPLPFSSRLLPSSCEHHLAVSAPLLASLSLPLPFANLLRHCCTTADVVEAVPKSLFPILHRRVRCEVGAVVDIAVQVVVDIAVQVVVDIAVQVTVHIAGVGGILHLYWARSQVPHVLEDSLPILHLLGEAAARRLGSRLAVVGGLGLGLGLSLELALHLDIRLVVVGAEVLLLFLPFLQGRADVASVPPGLYTMLQSLP
jgi:hypothetical protein